MKEVSSKLYRSRYYNPEGEHEYWKIAAKPVKTKEDKEKIKKMLDELFNETVK